ncbi:hypothetical protein FRC19_009196 [Serendipita sp. 401]|nr:hypothetical protein FRC19_009196 [Serendipita sp. 401]
MDVQFTKKISSLFGMHRKSRSAQKSDQEEPPLGQRGKRTSELITAKFGRASPLTLAPNNRINSNVPIERLPPELLAGIFQAYVHLDFSPFNLALVCHDWMSIALQTRPLWRYILVADITWDFRNMIRFSTPGTNDNFNMIGNKQVCATREELDNAIGRAGSVLLDVTVQFTRGELWVPFIKRMLSLSRELTSVELPLSLQYALKESQIWGNLRHFCSGQGQIWKISPLPESSNLILSKCRLIEEIVITLPTWPNANTMTLNYVKLRYAVLRCEIQFLARLHAPLLTYLSLCELPADDGRHSESIQLDLPSLETLLVDTRDPRWIYRSHLPSLVSLTMTLSLLSAYPPIPLFIPDGLPGVLNVTIKDFKSGLVIIPALESVPNAQTIKIIPSGCMTLHRLLSQELQRFLAPESSTLVSGAQSIQLGDAQAKIGCPREVLEPLLIKTRRRRGLHLQSFTVHWEGLPSAVEYA